ncbi:hypothetical protein JTE90_005023 [Oedothorax gibbosus]|uniref:Uncharacterized protein n=1 Tax=Oedothorax gibbosus TaxID=931172 RepID=A0AAV6VAE7_9ARAC|nr:hypothetical protein JTE90_005023 [Oedothorax gibbosus]
MGRGQTTPSIVPDWKHLSVRLSLLLLHAKGTSNIVRVSEGFGWKLSLSLNRTTIGDQLGSIKTITTTV